MTMRPDYKTIVVPVDLTSSAEPALREAMAIAERFDAAILLVHVCEEPPAAIASIDSYAILDSDAHRKLNDEAASELSKVAQRLGGLKVSTEVMFGNPAQCIVQAATAHNADLIVMGTHARGVVMHLVMGSVAEHVVRTAPCPVLTIREQRQAGTTETEIHARAVPTASARTPSAAESIRA